MAEVGGVVDADFDIDSVKFDEWLTDGQFWDSVSPFSSWFKSCHLTLIYQMLMPGFGGDMQIYDPWQVTLNQALLVPPLEFGNLGDQQP